LTTYFDGLARDLFHLRHDVAVVDLELVIDQQNACVGDQSRGVARDEVVVDDIEIVLHFDAV